MQKLAKSFDGVAENRKSMGNSNFSNSDIGNRHFIIIFVLLFQYRLQIASVETSNTLCLILGVCCRHHKSASKSRLRSQAFSRSSQGRLRRASSAGNSKLAYSQVRTPVWRTIFFSGSRFCEQKKNSNCMDLLQRFVSHMGHFE